ncbi:hypothetical protein N7452_008951 [Penicillium brevicompactum]|uniref:Peptidase C14 caspase domain-containing protein n=1 Tax=Penicillium brevicompactum TaxID=5074 RepID=A0A9W9Q7S4_PENBR|nr:hypothetical protein N7452_008951 [Penicillium brevicompactum]
MSISNTSNTSTEEPQRWAILIGINFYKDPINRLSGCVRDVTNIQACLETIGGPLNIFTFTASTPSGPDASYPSEPKAMWPTYSNFTSTIEQILHSGRKDDFVYIHFSGHGRRLRRAEKERGDFALVLVGDDDDRDEIEGFDLTKRLKMMIEKGINVTLVLDCCFSGSTPRQAGESGTATRTIGHRKLDHAIPLDLETDLRPGDPATGILRDAKFVPKWLLEPDGYGILAACGPHEVAKELNYNGERNGALSVFLCQAFYALQKAGVEMSHQELYQQICVQFHNYYPQQHPMLYGNPRHMFFGGPGNTCLAGGLPVFRSRDRKFLFLTAGYAHGVEMNDEFRLSPISSRSLNSPPRGREEFRAQVIAVHALVSELAPLNPNEPIDQVKTGWIANRRTWQSGPKIHVCLSETISSLDQWMAELSRRNEVVNLSFDSNEETPSLFHVTFEEQKGYEITDHKGQIQYGLLFNAGSSLQSVQAVFDLLERAAAFKFVEGLQNKQPDSAFEQSFEISLLNAKGEDFSAHGIVEIKSNEILTIKVRNLSSQPLYIAILDLCPSWKIECLTQIDGGGDYIPVPATSDTFSGEENQQFQMVVPSWARSKGLKRCEDVIKVFITREPTSFSSLLLPAAALDGSREQQYLGRSFIERNINLLMNGSLRSSTTQSADWSTRNFIIVTEDEL